MLMMLISKGRQDHHPHQYSFLSAPFYCQNIPNETVTVFSLQILVTKLYFTFPGI